MTLITLAKKEPVQLKENVNFLLQTCFLFIYSFIHLFVYLINLFKVTIFYAFTLIYFNNPALNENATFIFVIILFYFIKKKKMHAFSYSQL